MDFSNGGGRRDWKSQKMQTSFIDNHGPFTTLSDAKKIGGCCVTYSYNGILSKPFYCEKLQRVKTYLYFYFIVYVNV